MRHKDKELAMVSQEQETPGDTDLSEFYSKPHALDVSEKQEDH